MSIFAKPKPKRQYDILNVEEIQEYLPFSKRVIYGRLRDGTLPGFKIGRLWFMRRSELEALLKGLADATTTRPAR